ncbi:unnamed protein product [Gongylonema pulchrum]|uniref:Uncharacterized protein n=1 Tax=Gongylonema pulchrum TaxID=637853 RepID=A0A183D348_9BILA|nr:unnamed protein product [Gongylonema pulchrum]
MTFSRCCTQTKTLDVTALKCAAASLWNYNLWSSALTTLRTVQVVSAGYSVLDAFRARLAHYFVPVVKKGFDSTLIWRWLADVFMNLDAAIEMTTKNDDLTTFLRRFHWGNEERKQEKNNLTAEWIKKHHPEFVRNIRKELRRQAQLRRMLKTLNKIGLE